MRKVNILINKKTHKYNTLYRRHHSKTRGLQIIYYNNKKKKMNKQMLWNRIRDGSHVTEIDDKEDYKNVYRMNKR